MILLTIFALAYLLYSCEEKRFQAIERHREQARRSVHNRCSMITHSGIHKRMR